MRIREMLVGVLACVVAMSAAPSARASVRGARPAYSWALEATLVVTGRVEFVGTDKGTLRIAKALAGRADSETIEFAPVSHPECMSGRMDEDRTPRADVTVGDEVALFLVKGEGAGFEVLDGGYAKVGLGELGAHSLMERVPLAVVERLVSIMKTADLDARDRAMIAAATAEDQFLRHAACRYVEHDLGVASPLDRWERDPGVKDAAVQSHRAAVRRRGVEIAALVRRENGSEPCGAALEALSDAECAPEGAYEDIAKFARAIARLDRSQLATACHVLVLYDSADSATFIITLAKDEPGLLATLGASRRQESRSELLEEFGGADDHRVLAAASGLRRIVERGRDREIEDALFARLTGPVGPSMETTIAWALRSSRPLDVANAVLDKLASQSLSKDGEEAGTDVLYGYLRSVPPIPGFRELLVKRLTVITDRLDAGKTEATRPLYLLQQLGTPEAMASLRRAAASHPDPEMRQAAKWRSAPLDK